MAKRRSTNEKILDRQVAHQVGLLRYSKGVQRELLPILRRAYDELARELGERLGRLAAEGFEGPGSWTALRIHATMQELAPLIANQHRQIGAKLEEQLKKLAEYEVDFQGRLLTGSVPINYSWVKPGPEVLEAVVTQLPFNGEPLGGHVSRLAARQFKDVTERVQSGIVKGSTLDQLLRDLVGSKKRPGILYGKHRRAQIEAVVRTSVNHVATQSRLAMFEANSDIIKAWTFTAVLDSRVTLICAVEDGKTWPLGQGNPPPLHYGCRSVAVPVIRSAKELLGVGVEVEPKERAQLDGVAPGKIDYPTWLARQSRQMQEHVLGEERARLFRDDPHFRNRLDKFIDSTGRRYTLQELATHEGDLLASHP